MGTTVATAANGSIGDAIGTSLTLNNDTTALGLATFTQASADTDSFDLRLRKARGTTAAPTVITTGDELGTIQFHGCDAAGTYVNSAAIKAISSGTIAGTRIPSTLEFYTSTNATPSVQTKVCQFSNAGVMSVYSNILAVSPGGTLMGPSNGGWGVQPNGGSAWSGPHILNLTGTSNASSNAKGALTIDTTYTQTGTASSNDIRINRVDTTLGSGTHYFLDCQVSSTTKFNISNTGVASAAMGTGTGLAKLLGTATVNTTAVGNVGAGEDDLMTYSLPANSLSAAAKGVRIRVWGTTANNANAKTITLYFGTTAILTNALTVNLAGVWDISATVFSTGTDAQAYISTLDTFGAAGVALNDLETGTSAQDDGAAITIKCTGTATSNNDIIQTGFHIEMIN